jgi:vitamin B12 transporter
MLPPKSFARPRPKLLAAASLFGCVALGLVSGAPTRAEDASAEPAQPGDVDAGVLEPAFAAQDAGLASNDAAAPREDAAQYDAAEAGEAGSEMRGGPAVPTPVRAYEASAAPPPETATPPIEAPTPEARAQEGATRSTDVTVRGQSKVERLRRSAEAVHVIEIEQAKRQSADLGEVLARTQGVSVQRAGGLGSETRFSLNGLTDDQIRFFLDGVPLELAGYPFGIANVPVNLVERVEIYRGVVPIRFGADALGGAVNLVSDQDMHGTHGTASYQAGSFGTYRLTLSGQHLHEPSGWFTRASLFLDWAENNYPMTVDVPDERGQDTPTRVYRFHDAYRAQGGSVETGVIDKPWAKRLLLRAFITHYDKEIQHNLVMVAPYGDVELSELSAGGNVRYENVFAHRLSVNAIAGYVYRDITYSDLGECVYNWFGQCVRMRPQPGERTGIAHDQFYGDHNAFGRVNLGLRIRPEHNVRLSVSPTYATRTGDEKVETQNPDARDPLSAQRDLFTLVSGLEYKADLFEHLFENVVFVKDYLQLLRSEDPLATGVFRQEDRNTHRAGLGDSLRYTMAEWIYAKASYEWATRLPRPDEIFGNAFPIQPNLELRPELSHNVNVGLTLDAVVRRVGKLRADLNGFLRSADDLIVLVGDEKSAVYQNVYKARSLGVEAAAGFTSRGDYVVLDGNVTYVDFRNTSSKGPFAAYEGDRIPNRPYLFGNGSLRLQVHDLAAPHSQLALIWTSRYVHEFLRGWEGIGTDKLKVPSQLLHSLALTYFVQNDVAALSFSGEVTNITDQAAFDFFGVPRPGRAFYFKATASL